MSRKLREPGNNERDRSKPVNYNTENFGMGIIKDMPATKLPNNSLANGENVNAYPTEVQGRLGTELYTDLTVPGISGRTGLTASKSGYIITITANLFDESDVSNYFVWPSAAGSDPIREEIIRYISGFTVEVANSSTHAATTGCYIEGKQNFWGFHRILKKWIFQFGTEFYISDIEMTAFTKVIIVSHDSPNNCVSVYKDFDEFSGIVFNSNGIFKIDLANEIPIGYKVNTPIPNIACAAQPYNGNMNYQYGYIYGVARLDGNAPLRGRLTPQRIESESGTNIWDSAYRDYRDIWTRWAIGSGFDLDGVADSTTPHVVGPLYVPVVPNTSPQEYQKHLTHFTIYRTGDKQGLYKQGLVEAQLNDPEKFVWDKDLRICAAFYARRYNGNILAAVGVFEEADVGSTIEFEDGSLETIRSYVSPTSVRYSIYEYYAEESPWMAAAIGNGRVMRASQTGTTVTRTNGDAFTAADVGNTITWSTGYRSYITAYTDANTVTVHDDYDKEVQGLTLDPIYRYYNDSTSDDVLRTREVSLLCRTRFLENMDNCNTGIVVPGFMVTAQRNNKQINYCALPVGHEYTAGYHNKGYQISNAVKDDIQGFLLVPNKVIVLCSNRTWHTATNNAEIMVMPKSGIVCTVLPGFDILDGNIGCFDIGSVQEIEAGLYQFLTSEPGGIGWRKFNGFQYGANELEIPKLGQTNWEKEIRALQKATASIYDGEAGLIIWGRE